MRPDGRELLIDNLDLIGHVITFTCRRHHLQVADAEEFRSIVTLRLVENDYGILRKFEGRSKFSTFINIVIQRMFLDYRIQTWGKWHSSAEAMRLGSDAVLLERLTIRDGNSLDEAFAILQRSQPDLTRDQVEDMARRLPHRAPRPRHVPVDQIDSEAAQRNDIEEAMFDADQRKTSQQISRAMSRIISELHDDDRRIFELRFGCGMTVAQIARSLHLDQRRLYRRMERTFRAVRVLLERDGIVSRDVLDLIGRNQVDLDFSLRNSDSRPSTSDGGTLASTPEEASS